jgi:hypothetical protein
MKCSLFVALGVGIPLTASAALADAPLDPAYAYDLCDSIPSEPISPSYVRDVCPPPNPAAVPSKIPFHSGLQQPGITDSTARTPGTGGPDASEPDVLIGADMSEEPSPGSFGATTRSARGIGTPGMIGDFLFSGQFIDATRGGTGGYIPIGGGAIGRYKTSDNTSPLPQDRVAFQYIHYHDAGIGDSTIANFNTDQYTFIIEKTFGYCDSNSIELRVPFASAISQNDLASSFDSITATDFGDISLVFKRLLYRDPSIALAAGLGVELPTGPSVEIENIGTLFGDTLRVETDSVHLQPFLGIVCTPNRRTFTQAYYGLNFDAGENEFVNASLRGPNSFLGDASDQTLLFASISQGYWCYRNHCYNQYGLNGVAAIVELHYTTTIEGGDAVFNSSGDFVGGTVGRRDLLNLTAGFITHYGRNWYIRTGAGAPLRDDADRSFDAEYVLQINRHF